MRNVIVAVGLLFALTTFIIGNAYYKKKQFYPTVVYLTKHKPFFGIILLQCLTLLLILTKFVSWVFFGTVQRAELDSVVSRIWYTVFDTLLLFAFFQDEINAKFLFLITSILFSKGFHWLLEERVDHMERMPLIRWSFHTRTASFIIILTFLDIFHIWYFYWGVSSQNLASLAVGAEYYILLFELVSTIMRYILQTINTFHDTPWDQKSMYQLYVDVVVGLMRLFFYLDFAPILWANHPFPMFVIRPIYLNFRFLKKSVNDLLMSRRAIRLMNTVFQDVTAPEMASTADTVCIICREEMLPQAETPLVPGTVKRLPCGHIFHAACLRTWFQRQQTCPTCRLNVLRRHTPPAAPQAAGDRPEQDARGRALGRRAPGPQIRIGIQRTHRRIGQHASDGRGGISPNVRISEISGLDVPPNAGQPIIIPGSHLMPGLISPMPQPPTNLAEAIVTEQQLRGSIEDRIMTLQRIQLLLDAAILQLNAYVAATQSPATAATAAGCPPTETEPALPNATTPSIITQPPNPPMKNSSVENDASEKSRETGGSPKADNDDDLSTLRQRRLEKLNSDERKESVEGEPSMHPENI